MHAGGRRFKSVYLHFGLELDGIGKRKGFGKCAQWAHLSRLGKYHADTAAESGNRAGEYFKKTARSRLTAARNPVSFRSQSQETLHGTPRKAAGKTDKKLYLVFLRRSVDGNDRRLYLPASLVSDRRTQRVACGGC